MKPITVYVDETCGICKKVQKILRPLVTKKVTFKFADDMDFDPQSEPMINRYYDLYSHDGETFFKGYQTYVEITRRSYILFPIHLLMRIFFVRLIGEKIYRRIADSRACEI